jgi:hypothetical protein
VRTVFEPAEGGLYTEYMYRPSVRSACKADICLPARSATWTDLFNFAFLKGHGAAINCWSNDPIHNPKDLLRRSVRRTSSTMTDKEKCNEFRKKREISSHYPLPLSFNVSS